MTDHYIAYLEDELARVRQRLALTEAAWARDRRHLTGVDNALADNKCADCGCLHAAVQDALDGAQ